MDLYPTLADLAGAEIPADRTIDGVDISSLMFEENPAASPRDTFAYYDENNLEAIRNHRWKLHVGKVGEEMAELYDLESDIGETNNLYDSNPEVVAELSSELDSFRADLGDESTGITGTNIRPAGRVDNPDTLTHYDPDHPYIYAEYDNGDRG
jgi:arylsulfatase A-like enzyme